MAKFEMDTEFVRKLAQIRRRAISANELADGDRRIQIARPTVTYAAAPMTAPSARLPPRPSPAAPAGAGDRSIPGW
jgi:hypothetical protein